MTIDFCNEIQIVKPSTTVDKAPVDFKLENFILREAMRILKFSCQLSRSI